MVWVRAGRPHTSAIGKAKISLVGIPKKIRRLPYEIKKDSTGRLWFDFLGKSLTTNRKATAKKGGRRIMRMFLVGLLIRLVCLSHTTVMVKVGAFSLSSSSVTTTTTTSLSSMSAASSPPLPPPSIDDDVVVVGEPQRTNNYQKKNGGGPYTYAALDLDGTLLNSGHVLSDRTKETIRRLTADQGFRVLIATGRAISTVYHHVLDLNLDNGIVLPVISSNGAQGRLCALNKVVSAVDGTTRDEIQSTMLFSLSVPQSTVQMAIDQAQQLGLVVQYYVGDDIYANPTNDVPWQTELCHKYTVLTGSKTIYVDDDFAVAMQQGLPSKLLVLCPPDRQIEIMAQFDRAFQDTILEDRPHLVCGYLGWFMEILPPNVNKGSGLARMCAHLNISLDDVVAFGDGDNDFEFIQQAGWGIVMKNGRPVVKDVADEVIDWTNDEDGVVRTLEAMEARNELTVTL
jgi:Cof subfamily protein (haloacid dehalogenase superfamily)